MVQTKQPAVGKREKGEPRATRDEVHDYRRLVAATGASDLYVRALFAAYYEHTAKGRKPSSNDLVVDTYKKKNRMIDFWLKVNETDRTASLDLLDQIFREKLDRGVKRQALSKKKYSQDNRAIQFLEGLTEVLTLVAEQRSLRADAAGTQMALKRLETDEFESHDPDATRAVKHALVSHLKAIAALASTNQNQGVTDAYESIEQLHGIVTVVPFLEPKATPDLEL